VADRLSRLHFRRSDWERGLRSDIYGGSFTRRKESSHGSEGTEVPEVGTAASRPRRNGCGNADHVRANRDRTPMEDPGCRSWCEQRRRGGRQSDLLDAPGSEPSLTRQIELIRTLSSPCLATTPTADGDVTRWEHHTDRSNSRTATRHVHAGSAVDPGFGFGWLNRAWLRSRNRRSTSALRRLGIR